jgi:hypothetical protein
LFFSLAHHIYGWFLQVWKLWSCLPFWVQREVCPLPKVCPPRAAKEAEVLLAAAECGREHGGGMHHVWVVLPEHLTGGHVAPSHNSLSQTVSQWPLPPH